MQMGGVALPRAVLAVLVLLCLLGNASAGKFGTDFAKDFGKGIKDGLSPGVGDFQEGLGEIISLLSDDRSGDIDIPPCSETHCYYMQFLAGCVVFGSIIMPVLMLFCCCGFCCGRCCKACECCCRPCKQPACGGLEPTREKPYELYEKGLSFTCLFIAIVAMLSFSIVGFVAWIEVKGDYNKFWDGVVDLVETPDSVLNEIESSINSLRTTTQSTFTNLNALIEQPIADMATNVNAVQAAITDLRTDVEKLQAFVEGCLATAATCDPVTSSTDLNDAIIGSGASGCTAATQKATSNSRRAALVPGGSAHAQCPNGECNCCDTCIAVYTLLTSFESDLPSASNFANVNQPIPVADLQAELDNALGDWEAQMDEMRDATSGLDDIKRDQQDYRDALSESTIIIVGLVLFMLSWIISAMVMCAIPLSMQDGSTRRYGGYCWWTAFVLGVLYFILILSPAFGWYTIPSVAFYDICEALPKAGGSTDNLLSMIPQESQDDTLKKFLSDCLVAPDSYLWPLIPLAKTDITSQLDEFDKTELPAADISAVTDVDAMTDAWDTGANAAFTALLADDFGANSTLGTAYSTYITNTLLPSITTKRNAVNTAITALKDPSVGLTSAKFDTFKSDSLEGINSLVDQVWELGKCNKLHDPYEGLRAPMCDGMAGSLLSTWACLFMLCWFQLFTLYLINKTYKIMYRDKVPSDRAIEFTGVSAPDDHTPPEGEAEDVPRAVVPGGIGKSTGGGADFVYDAQAVENVPSAYPHPAQPGGIPQYPTGNIPQYPTGDIPQYPAGTVPQYPDPDSYNGFGDQLQPSYMQEQQAYQQQYSTHPPTVDYGYA